MRKFIGIDNSSLTHSICIINEEEQKIKEFLINNNEKDTRKATEKPNNSNIDENIKINEEIIDLNSDKIKELMSQYEKDTGKYAVWRGLVTEGFKKWLKGDKIYLRDKERISLYVSEDTKEKWLKYIK